MEKVITVPQKVDDLSGLFIDLRKSSFAVLNVGSDERGTYVYLDQREEKDPIPFVESWVGRVAPSPRDRKAFEARIKELKDASALVPELPAAPEESFQEAPGENAPVMEPPQEKVGLIRKLFRMITG